MNESPAYLPPPPASGDGAATTCLLVTRDDGLADHVALIAAACGVVLAVERRPPDPWPAGCTLALLGPDAVLDPSAAGPRVPVVLVGFASDRDGLWRVAARQPGVRVAILPEASAWLGEFLGERELHAGHGRLTVFAGGTGGTGTTTLAVLTALYAGRKGTRSLVVDADPHSRGIWALLGRPAAGGVGWEDLMRSRGQIAPGHLAGILPQVGGTSVLTWTHGQPAPVRGAILHEVIAAARRSFDAVVVDAGRSAGLGETLVQLADSVLVVASAAVPGSPQAFTPVGPDAGTTWRIVVTGSLPAGMDAPRVAAAAGLELLAYVPPTPALAAASAEGRLGSVLTRPRIRRRVEALLGWSLPAERPASGYDELAS
ncbi:septum site-determining protein Ssd [Arthrobacter sp.]|uniref:septum site-determining protein Ssd n=1 Tax=Arthrobacter sp. TaxID=1667 RepID=UPI003A94CE53